MYILCSGPRRRSAGHPGRGPEDLGLSQPWVGGPLAREMLQPGRDGPEGESSQEPGGSPTRGPRPRRVQFLLPHTTIQGPPPQEEERGFFQRMERLLGPAGQGGGFEELFAMAEGWEDLAEDHRLRKRLVRAGQGEAQRPRPGQEVTVKVLGALEDLSLVEKDPGRTFVLGQGEAVQALDLGVLSMQLGETSLFLAGPAFAYGHLGREPDIPKGAALLYEVALLQVRDGPDLGLLPATERLHLGNRKREWGNFHFERGEFLRALQSYQQALQVLPWPWTDPSSPEEGEEWRALRVKCLNNCAAAQLKLQQLDEALASCDEVTRLDPDNVKALYRKGKVLSEFGEDQAAMAVLKRALQLDPAMKAIHTELSQLARRQREQQGSPAGTPGRILPRDSPGSSVASGPQTTGPAPLPS